MDEKEKEKEKEYFKNMNKKQKMEHIWEYYRLPIIAGIAAIILGAAFIYSMATKSKEVFNLTIIGNVIYDNKLEETENKITKLVANKGAKREKAAIQIIPLSDSNGDVQSNYQYVMKFQAQIAAHGIDIMIMDKSYYTQLLQQQGLMKLDGTEAVSTVTDKTKLWVNDSDKGVYGVSVEGNKLFENMGMDTKDKVMCIASNTERKAKSITVFKWILDQK